MKITGFIDRRHAGRLLARKLRKYSRRDDVSVLALPRGGVPVALEVAAILEAPLDIFVVRKLGVPGTEEFAMGAVASGGIRVLHLDVIRKLRIPDAMVEAITERQFAELHRREQIYGVDRPGRSFTGRVVIVVDDGMATGSSMEAAVAALREHKPARIIVAVPVTAAETFARFRHIADEIVAVITPSPLFSVGEWYESFSQLTDEDVHTLLACAKHSTATPA